MRGVEDELRLHYQALDPAAGDGLPTLEQRAADLRRILAEPAGVTQLPVRPAARPRSLPRRRLLAVGLVAATVVAGTAIGVTLLDSGLQSAGGQQFNPLVVEPIGPGQPPAADLLRQLAAKVEAIPDSVGLGAWEEVRSVTWVLDRPVDRSTATQQRTIDLEVVTEPDGTRLLGRPHGSGPPTFEHYRPGGKDDNYLGAIPQDEAAFGPWLWQGPVLRGHTFYRVAELFGTRALNPRQRAWVLRQLATVTDLNSPGRATDHAGRRGLAITIDDVDAPGGFGKPVRITLVLDETDGSLLARETVLTKDPGHFDDVPLPAVWVYQEFRPVVRRIPAK
ncbi:MULTISPECIES: hypothetical protein [unclassified Crossiella]|uniref:hypothetical protein n=1 Tax=unclassified Crossiella TaxID=2620835 RepID=UPI001FFE87DC|nr:MULTISPECIES: hypothetical protein [unclassified Crossiella]MCK2236875.1 hypothetical protein [Crossiella sp. S99.2]MCK2250543.1 hypothetical protein [Crossiella sp. S99.1]